MRIRRGVSELVGAPSMGAKLAVKRSAKSSGDPDGVNPDLMNEPKILPHSTLLTGRGSLRAQARAASSGG